MGEVAKLVVSIALVFGIAACDQQSKPETNDASADVGTTQHGTGDASTQAAIAKAPSWTSQSVPDAATFTVVRDDEQIWMQKGDTRIVGLKPTIVTIWVDAEGSQKVTETELPIQSLNDEGEAGFAAYFEAKDELGRWRLRAENAAGDPRIKYALSGKFGRDVAVERQEIVFKLPQATAPEVLLRGRTYETVASAHESHALTPQRIRWPKQSLSFLGGLGVHGYRLEQSDQSWRLFVQTYDAKIHPTGDSGCGDINRPLSAARLKKKTKVEARWQFRASTSEGVNPSNFAGAALAGVAVVIDDTEPNFEQTKALNVGVPTVDSDGALEIGMFYTRAVPGGDVLASLGGVPKTASSYGVEYIPRGRGVDTPKTFRDRFDAVTFWTGDDAGCDALSPDGPFQEHVNLGYRNFYSGVSADGFDLLDPTVIARGAAIHSYPHKLERGSPTPTIFASSRVAGPKALADMIKPAPLDKLKAARGMAILHTSMSDWVAQGESGWITIPESRGAMLLLARYRNERRLAVGPVRDIVGHAAAMQSVDIEELPDGWVRVRNLTGHDLKAATFELPEGAATLFPRGSRATTEGRMVYFDLPARGEQLFQVTGTKDWLSPARIAVDSGQ